MRTKAVLAIVGIAVLVVVGLLLAYGYFSEPRFSKGSKVVLIGDSIAYQADSQVEAALKQEGWRVEVDAVPGATITGGGFADVDWVSRIRDIVRGGPPDVVVVELGTNGCGDCSKPRDGIDQIMQELRLVRLVLWLNVRTDAPIPQPAPKTARQINRALDEAADRWRNLRIVDMNGFFEDHPDLISADRVHPTSEGQFAFGLFIAQHLDKYLIK
jgi:lysophospholipase L1-like esterase